MTCSIAVKNGNLARSVFSYCEIAGIKVDIVDIKSENYQIIAKEFSKFFDEPKKRIIENSQSFTQLIAAVGSPDELSKAVRLYKFQHPQSTGAAYLCSRCSIPAIKIPFGGQNHRR